MTHKVINAEKLLDLVENEIYDEITVERGPGNSFLLKRAGTSNNPNLNMFPDSTIQHHIFFELVQPDENLIHSIQDVFQKKATLSLKLSGRKLDQIMRHAVPVAPQVFEPKMAKTVQNDATAERQSMIGRRV